MSRRVGRSGATSRRLLLRALSVLALSMWLAVGGCGGKTGLGLGLDAGAASDARPSDSGARADAGCAVCDSVRLVWGYSGGKACWQDVSALLECREFSFVRTPSLCKDVPASGCVRTVDECASPLIDRSDVSAALAHPDVIAARAAAPIFYGSDSRPVDGAVFDFVVQGEATVTVGDACRGPGPCTPIPPGVAALVSLLNAFTAQELAREPCASEIRS